MKHSQAVSTVRIYSRPEFHKNIFQCLLLFWNWSNGTLSKDELRLKGWPVNLQPKSNSFVSIRTICPSKIHVNWYKRLKKINLMCSLVFVIEMSCSRCIVQYAHFDRKFLMQSFWSAQLLAKETYRCWSLKWMCKMGSLIIRKIQIYVFDFQSIWKSYQACEDCSMLFSQSLQEGRKLWI